MFKIIKLDIMKKLLFTIALFCGMTVYAQQEGVRVPSGYQGFLEEGNCWHFTKDLSSTISLSTTHGFYFNGNMYVGVGVGLERNTDFTLFPFYASMRYLFTNQKAVSPVVGVRIGSYTSSYNTGGYADLAIGVRFASKRDFAVNLMLAASYLDKVEYEISEYEYDILGNRITKWIPKEANPTGISLRIGIEW
jgi:hypothetical protein